MADVAGVIAARLVNEGVTVAFGLLGEANLALMLALRAAGIDWVALRREDSVIAAADGYAQGSRRLGVALVSQGPALANALNPLIGAAKGRTPLLVLTGAVAQDRREEPQWLDQRALVEGTGHARYSRLDDAAEVDVVLDQAISTAVSGCVPVVLEVPTHLQLHAAEPAQTRPSAQTRPPSPSPPSGEPDLPLSALSEALSTAERPLLLAGRGAMHARSAIVELAAATGALLGTTLLSKGLFDGEPASLGVVGGFSTERGRDLSAAADLVVAFGAGLNRFTSNGGRVQDGATIIHVDLAPAASGAQTVVGDAQEVAEALLTTINRRHEPWHAHPGAPDVVDDQSDVDGLDLRIVSQWLDQNVAHDRALSVDLGYFSSEPSVHIQVRHPDRHAFSLHFGSIGLGLATAIGLSRAHPGIPTVAAVGDGGLMSSLQELETVVRLKLPIIVAVYDDDAYAVEVYELEHRGEDSAPATFPAVDFASVGRALGIESRTLASLPDLEAAAPLVGAPTGPVLLDFRLRRGVITRWYRDSVHPDFDDTIGTENSP